MRTLPLLAALAAFSVAACNQAEQAAVSTTPAAARSWALVPDQSRLSFVSVKAGEIAEVHHFASLSGAVAADGTATLSIPLDSVQTGIDIRDERMRKFLFETTTYPTASFTAKLDLASLQTLAIGEQRRMPIAGTLALRGMTVPVETQVAVIRAADGKVLVVSLDPIVVQADSFGLQKGLAELQKLANLPGITPAVPVSFQLMFVSEG